MKPFTTGNSKLLDSIKTIYTHLYRNFLVSIVQPICCSKSFLSRCYRAGSVEILTGTSLVISLVMGNSSVQGVGMIVDQELQA